MRIAAALVGNLEEVMAAELSEGEQAVTAGTRTTVDWLKGFLRAETVRAFGSDRLAKTWRSDVYPKGKQSLGSAGVVFSKAPHIIEAFSASTTIRSQSGFFLAIPTPETMAMRTSRGERPTPHSIEQRLGIALQFVYRAQGASMLVANLRRRTGKRGGFAAPSAAAQRKGNVESVVMFFLVPFVRLKQVFDLEATYSRALDELVANVLREWNDGRTQA